MAKVITDPKIIDSILERGVIMEVLPSKESFREALLAGRRLRFYIGIDPTSPSLHLGHGGNLLLLEDFRSLGHETIVVMGDFTARIGDPSGRTTARVPLSAKEIKENVGQIVKQIKRLVSAKIYFNSSWLEKLTFADLVNLAARFTVQQMIERDMFKERLSNGKPVHLHEFLYPLMQGYDSVALKPDVEIGGTDQTFNMLAGRTLLRQIKEKEKFVVATRLLANPKTGELMSKSSGTGVFLDASAEEMFGQIMASPDEMVEPLAITNTRLELKEVARLAGDAGAGGEKARDAKLRLAEEIVSRYHSPDAARAARESFIKTFSSGEAPAGIETKSFDGPTGALLDLVSFSGLVGSKTEARRLIEDGAVEIDGEVKQDPHEIIDLKNGIVLRVGKHRFARIKS